MASSVDTTFEGAVFAVFSFALEQDQLDTRPPHVNVPITFTEGPNGTAFFISPTDFVTAHHVLNTKLRMGGTVFIANNAGYLYCDFEIISERPEADTTVCRLTNQTHAHFLELNQAEVSTADTLMSFGIDRAQHGPITAQIRKANNSLSVVVTGRIYFEKRQSTFVESEFVDCLNSTGDDPVTLRQTTILITEPQLPAGFSGGPTINVETGEVVGLASMQVTTTGDNGVLHKFRTAQIPLNQSV